MPLEIMHLPRWFPFHLSKVVVLVAHCDRAAAGADGAACDGRAIRNVAIDELFRHAAGAQVRDWIRGAGTGQPGGGSSSGLIVLRVAAPIFRRRRRGSARSIRAVRFVTERLNGDDGFGGIYPAIASSVMMFDALGLPARRSAARRDSPAGGAPAAGGRSGTRAYCQPTPVADHGDGLARARSPRRDGGGARGACLETPS